MNRRFSFALTLAALTLSACTTGHNLRNIEHEIAKNGRYWQRVSASESVWMQGPKAQQMLNRDIARCVTELTELERVGQIKNAFPAEPKDVKKADSDARESMMAWDTPERDGMLLAEGTQYIDYETCMKAKGWERILSVPYDTGLRAASNYTANHVYLKDKKAIYEEQNFNKGEHEIGRYNN